MGWLREPELSAGHSSDMRFPGSSEGGKGGVRLCPTHLAELPETNRKEVKITLEETDGAISNRVQEKTEPICRGPLASSTSPMSSVLTPSVFPSNPSTAARVLQPLQPSVLTQCSLDTI